MHLFALCYRYHVKACLNVFPWLHYLLWLLRWNLQRANKLGLMSKVKCCKTAPQPQSIIPILLWVNIHHVNACLFVFLIVPYLFWLFHCNVHGVRKFGPMSNIKCCKIAPVYEIQHNVSADFCKATTHDWSDTKMTYELLTTWSHFYFWHCPPNVLTLHTPKRNNHNRASIERQIRGLFIDI